MNLFFQWLSAIPFSGGGFNDVAIAEGLADALMMFSSLNGNQNQNAEVHRHCILVAASNPYPIPTPVYQPQPPQNFVKNGNETRPINDLSDAETLANFFSQFAISLSVICPKQLPKLRGIYNAGKFNPRAADPPVNNVKNPHFLVLISEKFMEARTSLGHFGMTSLPSNLNIVKTDVSVPPVAGITPASVSSANVSILLQQPVSTGNIHSATVKSSGLPGPLPISATGQVQKLAPASLISAASNVSVNSSIVMSQPLSNLQGSVSLGQTILGMSQGNLPITQMVQTGMSMNQSLMSGSGATGTGAMVPPPGLTQQGQPKMQPISVNSNNFMTNVALNQQTSSAMESGQSKYVKIWEGRLSGQRQGQLVSIIKLEGFRDASASETLAANWPPIMKIVHLISEDQMNSMYYDGKADFIYFRALDPHGFLGQLQEKKFSAVIQLPSQTMLLSVSDKAQRLIGVLFPGDMLVRKPQTPNQQQLPQSQQQQRLPQMQQQPLAQQQQQQQQMPQLQQRPQHTVSTGTNQAYIQGGGRSQLLSEGPVSSQGPPTMSGGES